MTRFFLRSPLSLLLLSLLVTSAGAATTEPELGAEGFSPSPSRTVGWRGDGNGCFTSAGQVPTSWDVASGKNILWKTAMPSWTASSCFVVGKLVVTKAEPDLVIACDRTTGKILWQTHVNPVAVPAQVYAEALPLITKIAVEAFDNCMDTEKPFPAGLDKTQVDRLFPLDGKGRLDPHNLGATVTNYIHQGSSMSTPVSDGSGIFVVMGNGLAARLDLSGAITWKQVLKPKKMAGKHAAVSPLLVDGILICQLPKTQGESATMVGLEAQTGKQLWECTDVHTSGWAAGSPVQMRTGGKSLIITAGGTVLDAKTGERLLYRIGAHRDGGSPGVLGDVVCFGTADERGLGLKSEERVEGEKLLEPPKFPAGARGIRLTVKDGKVSGQVLYHVNKVVNTFNATIMHPAGFAFYQDVSKLYVVDVKSGKLAQEPWRAKRPEKKEDVGFNYCPPFATRDLLFVDYHGPIRANAVNRIDVLRIGADGSLKPVSVNTLPRHIGSPFIQGDRIYVRTISELICIGTK